MARSAHNGYHWHLGILKAVRCSMPSALLRNLVCASCVLTVQFLTTIRHSRTEGCAFLFSTPPSSGWTGVSDCAGFAPNHKPKAVCHEPRFHSRPATLLRPPFCPFHRSALFLPAAAQVKKETSRKRQKGKKHEIRRSQHTNQRGRGFPRCSIGVRSQRSPHRIPRSNGEVSHLQLPMCSIT